MWMKGFSFVGAAAMLMGLAACGHEGPDANTPASDTMQSEDEVRVGPTPTNGTTTPSNPDSNADASALGVHPVVPPPPAATTTPYYYPPPSEQNLTPTPPPP